MHPVKFDGYREIEDVPVVEFIYLVFTRMPGEGYRRRFGSLLLSTCDVIRALINSLCFLALCVVVVIVMVIQPQAFVFRK